MLAIIVYFVATRDDGEENRAAYCSALSDMVGSDSLEQALKGASKAEVERITELAPGDVEPAWDSLSAAALDDDPTATESQVDAAKLPAVLDKVTEDAAENCDLTLPCVRRWRGQSQPLIRPMRATAMAAIITTRRRRPVESSTGHEM